MILLVILIQLFVSDSCKKIEMPTTADFSGVSQRGIELLMSILLGEPIVNLLIICFFGLITHEPQV
jgi:hypothetical protein